MTMISLSSGKAFSTLGSLRDLHDYPSSKPANMEHQCLFRTVPQAVGPFSSQKLKEMVFQNNLDDIL